MKLNLKKARKLESKIEGKIQKLSGPLREDSVNILATWDDARINEKLQGASTNLVSSIELVKALVLIRSSIREAIAAANEAHSINFNIALRNALVAMIDKVYRPLANLSPAQPTEVADAVEIFKATGQENSSYRSNSPLLSVRFVSEEKVNEYKKDLHDAEKRLEDLDDKLSGLNLSHTITLSAGEVETLAKVNLP